MTKMHLYTASCTGNEKNCRYPNEVAVSSEESLRAAVARDHVCAKYKNSYRSNDNFLSADCIVMDCDNDHSDDPKDWITSEALAEELSDVDFGITESRHNNMPKDGKSARPRFHIYMRTREYKDPDAYTALKHAVQERYPFFDDNALDAGRFVYGSASPKVIWHEGGKTIEEFLTSALSAERVIPAGKRNATMSHFAGKVVKRFGHGDDAYQIFLEEAEHCDPPLSDEELDKIWHSAGKFEKKVSAQPGYIPPDKYNPAKLSGPVGSLKPQDYSDIGEAKVLSRECGKELRFNPATDYLRYNGVNWDENREAAVGMTEEFLDKQLMDAEALYFKLSEELKNAGADPNVLKSGGKKAVEGLSKNVLALYQKYLDAAAYLAFVMKRRDYKYIKSTLDTTKPMVFIEFEDLDKDEFLLNTPDGTWDLTQGLAGKQEHKAENYITKVTEVEPGDKGADLWQDTLEKTFLGDQDLIDYVQEVVGLSAIGKVYVEAMIIAYGEGRNGKSTFWNTISRVLGSYAGHLSADTLTVGCKRNVKPEMAETKGKRLIIAAELEEGMRLNTSVVKQLCSTDEIYAEKKYKAPASFIPSHTVVLYTNHLPRVGATDEGTWRRLIVIPFNAVFEGSNDKKNYTDYLVQEAGPAVLTWIINGAKKVIDKDFHLTQPKVVRDAIDSYRNQSDWLGMFLEDCCDVDPGYEAASGELYVQYRAYSQRMGEFARSTAEFYTALETAGFTKVRKKNGRFIKGLRLKVGDFMNEE